MRHTARSSSFHQTSPRLQTLPQAQHRTLHHLHLSLHTARPQPNLRLCRECARSEMVRLVKRRGETKAGDATQDTTALSLNKCKQHGPCRILLPATTDATSESFRASPSFFFTRRSPYEYRDRRAKSERRKSGSQSDDFNTCREARRRRGIGCVSRRFGGGFGGACVVF